MIYKPASVSRGEERWGRAYSAQYESPTLKFMCFLDANRNEIREEDMFEFIEYRRDREQWLSACLEAFREIFRTAAPIYAEWDR